jgi:ABC-type transporter Mla subunit MlaD
MEQYRKAPTDEARARLQAEVQRMKERVKDLLGQMAELARGFQDEHMNAEALAELGKAQDLLGGLDEVEKKLAEGDLEGAMKALDEMASAMDRMVAGLERTAGRPGEQNAELMKQMLAFKEALEKVKGEQERTAEETEKVRSEYRKRLAERLKGAERELSRLQKLAGDARRDVESAQPGIPPRAEQEYEVAKESLGNLERALGMKDLGTAWDTVQRASPSTSRLSQFLEEDARLAQDGGFAPDPGGGRVEEAHQRVEQAVPKVEEVREALRKLFPDPRQVLGQDAQRALDRLARRQAELEKQAAGLQQQLGELMSQAPVFPPDAQQQLGESRGHMGQAAAELGAKNPQRGHGEQELALDALERFQQGLEEAARRGGQGGGQGFPFPFAQSSGGEQEGDGRDPSRERVEIPGAEAHQVPEEFRRDLLEAMKQGSPERYRADVQRYYEELVK